MAIRPLLTLLLFSLLLHFTSACPLGENTTFIPHHDKRWYSIKLEQNAPPIVPQTWPQKDNRHDPNQAISHPIRYCYKDEATYNLLNPIVQRAIQIWTPAMAPYSTMSIECDIADPQCLCTRAATGVRVASDDALIIQDWDGGSRSSTGWTSVSNQDKTPNELMFTRVDSTIVNGQVTTVGNSDRVRMAHELGHAMGLSHEHQRPDAAKYVTFECKNVKGYDTWAAQIAAGAVKNGAAKPGDSLQKACTDWDTAYRYGFLSEAFIPRSPPTAKMIGEKGYSNKKFDYMSIMLYNSYEGAGQVGNFPTGAVIYQPATGKGAAKGLPQRLYMGGQDKSRVTSVSDGDMARIAQLYPANTPQGVQRRKDAANNWGGFFG